MTAPRVGAERGASAGSPDGRPVKVVHVITRLNIGGTTKHVVMLARSLDRAGWTPVLVAGRVDEFEGDMSDFAAAHEVQVVEIPTLRNRAGPLADLASLIALYRLFRRERPDIVDLHLFKARLLGGLAARLARVPVVVETFHGTLFAEYYPPVVSWGLKVMERALARLMSVVIAVSSSVAEELVRLGVTPASKVSVIPVGLDLAPFLPSGRSGMLREELRVPEGTFLVGAVGRLVPIKGWRYFIDAAACIVRRIPHTWFVIVGDGPEAAALRRQVGNARLESEVRFLGWRRDPEQLYPDLDVVALPSLNEGTPVSVIEAMASGRAVVATSVGGVPDVVEDGVTGVLVPPRDAQALAEAVIRLLENPSERCRFGAAARERIRGRFDADRLARDMDAVYRAQLQRLATRPEGGNR